MRRLALFVTLGGALACFGEPDVPAAVAPIPAAPAMRFVVASSLNLRATPDGEVLGKLAINSPVTLLSEEGDHARVRSANGREGYVASRFLSDARLTVEHAMASYQAATTAADRLSWVQRAAAVDDRDRVVLVALADAYRAAGQADVAARVDDMLAWPSEVRLVGAHGSSDGVLAVEWAEFTPTSYDDVPLGPVSIEEIKGLGLEAGAPVWVLPARSPAVRGRLAGVERRVFNECGGSFGYVLLVEAPLPPAESALAYTFGEPPASWAERGPERDLEGAIAAARRASAGLGLPNPTFHAAPSATGVRVRLSAERPSGDDEVPTWQVVDVDVGGDGVAVVRSNVEVQSYIGVEYPAHGRDLDGDGTLDLVYEGGCMQQVFDGAGVLRAETSMLCCGC